MNSGRPSSRIGRPLPVIPMRRAVHLHRTTVGKKILMAATGLILFAFVVGHLVGNLKLLQGEQKFDAYSASLRQAGAPLAGEGQLLWLARLVLLVAVAVHVVAAVQLTRISRRARPVGYRKTSDLSFSYASRTMRWGGVIILAFVVYHLLHLTFGTLHHDFSDSVYRNVVAGFRRWPVAAAYMAAMIPLGLHIYHGLWSATQTLALCNPRIDRWRRPAALAVAVAITAGNLGLPLVVLAGLVE